MRQISALSLFLAISINLALTSDISAREPNLKQWLEEAAEKSPNLQIDYRYEMPNLKPLLEKVQGSLKAGTDVPDTVDLSGDIKLEGGNLKVGGKNVALKAWDKDQHHRKAKAAVWELPLGKEVEIYLQIHGINDYVVFLNGKRLVLVSGSFWTDPDSGNLHVTATKGTNRIVVVSKKAFDNQPQAAFVPAIGGKWLAPTLDAKIPHKVDANGQRELREVIYRLLRGVQGHGELISEGLGIYVKRDQNLFTRDLPEESLVEIRNLVNSYGYLTPEEQLQYIEMVRRNLPHGVLESMLPDAKTVKSYHAFRIFDHHAHLLTYSRKFRELDELLGIVRTRYIGNSDNRDYAIRYREFLIRQAERFANVGEYQLALNVMDDQNLIKNASENNLDRQASYKKASFLIGRQTSLQVVSDPGVMMQLEEFRQLLKRASEKDPDREALNRALSIFTKYGKNNLFKDSVLRNLKAGLLEELHKNKAFEAALKTYASERMKDNIESAIARADLEKLEELILLYGGLVETAGMHNTLMSEYLDRCKFEKAYRHASYLYGANQEMKVRVEALARLMFLEKILGFSGRLRTPVESSLESSTVNFKGGEIKLNDLEKEIWGEARKSIERKKPRPGKYIGSTRIPGIDQAFMEPDVYGFDNYISDSQPAEVSFGEDSVLISSPRAIGLIDPSSGKEKWVRQPAYGEAPSLPNDLRKDFPAEIVGEKIISMQPRYDGRSYTICAYDIEGNKIWDMNDHPESSGFHAVCSPMMAFSSCFTILYSTTGSTEQVQFSLARLNVSDGSIEDRTPLNQVTSSSAGWNARFGSHFTIDGNTLYGYSGSGMLFRVNPETLALDWAIALPIHPAFDRSKTPSGFIQAFGNEIVSYLPAIQTWVGADKHSGRIMWQKTGSWGATSIHSRGNNEILVTSSFESQRDPMLIRTDPKTGAHIWEHPANGLVFTGEGTIQGDYIYVPCKSGIAIYRIKDGGFEHLYPTPSAPDKIRVGDHGWAILSGDTMHLFANDGKFESERIVPLPAGSGMPQHPASRQLNSEYPEIYIERSINNPVENARSDSGLGVTPTTKPALWMMRKHWRAALIRESYKDEKGRRQLPRVIWSDYFPNLEVEGDYLLTWNRYSLKVIDVFTRKPVFEYNAKQTRQVTQNHEERINQADIAGDHIVIKEGNDRLRVYNYKNGQQLSCFNYQGEIKGFDLNSKILALQNRHILDGVNINTGQKVWSISVKKDHRPMMFRRGSELLSNHNGWVLIDIANGKAQKLEGCSVATDNQWVSAKDNFLYCSGKCYFFGTKKTIDDVLDVDADRNGGTAVLTNKSFVYYGKDKQITLPLPDENNRTQIKQRRGSYAFEVEKIGDRIVAIINNSLITYNATDGKTFSETTMHYSYDGQGAVRPIRILDSSILATKGENLSFFGFRGQKKHIYDQVVSTFKTENEKSWPDEGWFPATKLNRDMWIAQTMDAPERDIELSLGSTRKELLIHLSRRFLEKPQRTSLMRASIMNIDLLWEMDTSNSCRSSNSIAGDIKSWKMVDENGIEHFYIRFEIAQISNNNYNSHRGKFPPATIEIEERINDQTAGLLRHGGVYDPGAYTINNGYTRINYCQSMDNFLVRKALYENSTSFLPQGRDLASWMQTRRVLNGSQDNLKFLEEFAGRVSKSQAVINVLSAMFLEKLEAVREKDRGALENTDEFVKKCQGFLLEVEKFARKAKIPDPWILRATTIFTLEVYPSDIRGWFSRYYEPFSISENGRQLTSSYYSYPGTFDSGYRNRPYVAYLLPGLFSASPYKTADQIQLPRTSDGLGRILAITPGSVIELIARDGKMAAGVSGKDIKTDITKVVDGEVISLYSNGGYRNTIKIPAIDLGDPGKGEVISSENILLALRNLPSDSNIGFNLIDRYNEAVRIEKVEKPLSQEELYSTLLNRTMNSKRIVYDAVSRMRGIFSRKEGATDKSILNDMDNFMSENKLPREFRREIMLPYTDFFKQRELWSNLGPVRWEEQDFEIKPNTVSVDELTKTKFILKKREYQFGMSSEKAPKTRYSSFQLHGGSNQAGRMLVYHATLINVDKEKRAWVFLKRASPHEGDTEITIYHNGSKLHEQALKRSEDDMIAVPVRLNEGSNMFMIRAIFTRNWDLRFSIADSKGIPLENTMQRAP